MPTEDGPAFFGAIADEQGRPGSEVGPESNIHRGRDRLTFRIQRVDVLAARVDGRNDPLRLVRKSGMGQHGPVAQSLQGAGGEERNVQSDAHALRSGYTDAESRERSGPLSHRDGSEVVGRDAGFPHCPINQDVELLECLQLSDKANILVKDPEIRREFEFESRKEAEKAVKEFESLRNNLAHSQDIERFNWDAIVEMAQRIDRIVARI